MSVIIGVCGQNFATLWADQRMIQYQDGQPISFRDDVIKIFRLNERVLFGAAGLFKNGEDVRDAVSGLEDLERASVKVCKDAILSFLKANQRAGRYLPVRNYILASKQKDGTFIMYSVHWDPDTKKAKATSYYPYTGDAAFGMVVALPQAPTQFQKECEDSVARLITTAQTYNTLDVGITTLIQEISKRNPTVSPDSMSLRLL